MNRLHAAQAISFCYTAEDESSAKKLKIDVESEKVAQPMDVEQKSEEKCDTEAAVEAAVSSDQNEAREVPAEQKENPMEIECKSDENPDEKKSDAEASGVSIEQEIEGETSDPKESETVSIEQEIEADVEVDVEDTTQDELDVIGFSPDFEGFSESTAEMKSEEESSDSDSSGSSID